MATRKVLLAAALWLASSNAHLFINSPKPITGTAPKNPLDPSGSDFPCHGVSLPSTGGQSMAAGSKQTLSFDLGGGANTAIHGGGSCQMSITYETDPAKQKDPKNWKVIYSIEGGCPGTAAGNPSVAVACGPGKETECINTFPFEIPKGVKDGHAIMAWTWFNNVGNREMYMNCINTEFKGGDGSEMDSFPNMFVANLASVDKCPTTEGVAVKFANPGKYVTTHAQAAAFKLAVPTGAGCAGDGGSGGGQAQSTAPSAPATATAAPSAAAPSSAAAPTSKAAIPSRMPASSQAQTTQAPAPMTSAAPKAAPAPSKPASGSGKCSDGTVSCPTVNDIICIDPSTFGICDVDNCAVPQAVAPGTTCQGGKIQKRRKRRGLEEHKAQHGRYDF